MKLAQGLSVQSALRHHGAGQRDQPELAVAICGWSAKHLQLTADERTFSASRHEMTQLDTALNFPLETLYSYISPRLYNSINQINQHSPETATKFRNLEQAFTLHDSSLESAQFWQAYRQYQEDAFYEMRVQPCVHPANQKLPCAPQLLPSCSISSRETSNPWHSSFQPGISPPASSAGWLSGIPRSRWTTSLRHLQAPGTTRPTATRGAAHGQSAGGLAPQYSLSIIYRTSSIGGVPPAWLAITADSGLEGRHPGDRQSAPCCSPVLPCWPSR